MKNPKIPLSNKVPQNKIKIKRNKNRNRCKNKKRNKKTHNNNTMIPNQFNRKNLFSKTIYKKEKKQKQKTKKKSTEKRNKYLIFSIYPLLPLNAKLTNSNNPKLQITSKVLKEQEEKVVIKTETPYTKYPET